MIKMIGLAYIICTVYTPLSVASTDDFPGLYSGSIADKKVIVLISKNSGENKEWRGKYFYRSSKKDIALYIKQDQKRLFVTEKLNSTTTGYWTLVYKTRKKSGRWLSGKWKATQQSKSHKIFLRKIDISAVVDASVSELYNSFKIKLRIEKGKTHDKSGVSYIWRYSHARKGQSRIGFPYLIKHPNNIILPYVHNIIEAHHRSLVFQALNCDQSYVEIKSNTKYGHFELKSKVALLTKKVLSIKASVSWICAGIAIGNNSSRSLTIDLTNGKVFSFTNYFTHKARYGREKDKIKTLARKYFKRMPKQVRDFDCLEFYSPLHPYSLSLAKNGLVFNLDLPRAMAACIEDVVIPYSALTQYVRVNYRNIHR